MHKDITDTCVIKPDFSRKKQIWRTLTVANQLSLLVLCFASEKTKKEKKNMSEILADGKNTANRHILGVEVCNI